MMNFFEPLFDIIYLGLVIFLGIRLLLEDNKSARRFGLMAVILGVGDAFHLLPRIVSNLMENGFEKNVFYLSYGELITSITMTLFYVLFYYYYREISKDEDNKKRNLIFILAVIRVVLTLLPQNQWGTKGSYTFGIIRNIPFAIIGLLLIIWTYKFKEKDGLKNTSLLITLSFLFYLPVVLGARFIPVLGAFMIPKTIAYVFLVLVGYRYFIKDLSKIHLLKMGITFLIMGLIGGVFYREFTKIFKYTAKTPLSVVHVHLIVLGFLFLTILYLIVRSWDSDLNSIKKIYGHYLLGLTMTVATFMLRGIYTITSEGVKLFKDAMLSGVAGLGHLILGVSLVMLMIRVANHESKNLNNI